VKPLGFIQTNKYQFNTLEHDLLMEIFNGLDNVAGCDKLEDDSMCEVVGRIFKVIKIIIEQMMDLMAGDIKLLVDLGTEINNSCLIRAIDHHHEVVNALMHHLVHGFGHKGLELLGKRFIEKTCRQLEEFHEQSSLLNSHCLFDFQIFSGLMSLKLVEFPCGSELSEFGLELESKAKYFYSNEALLESSSSMTTTQRNILSRIEPLFHTAQAILLLRKNRYSLSWDEPDRKEAVIDIKQKLRDSLSSLDVSSPEAEDMSDLHAGFVKNMLNIFRNLYINITMNSPQNISEFHEFHLACIMKMIMSSNKKLRSEGWEIMFDKILIEQQVEDEQIVPSYEVSVESLDSRDKNASGVYSVDQVYLIKQSWTDGVVRLLYMKGPMSMDCFRDTDDNTCHYLLQSPAGKGPYLIKKVEDSISDVGTAKSITPLETKMTSAQELATWVIKNEIINRARTDKETTYAQTCYRVLEHFVRDICAKEDGVDKPITNMLKKQEAKTTRKSSHKETSDAIVGAAKPISENVHKAQDCMVEEQKVDKPRRSKRRRISETTREGVDGATINDIINEPTNNFREAKDLEIETQNLKTPRRSKRKRKRVRARPLMITCNIRWCFIE
jgi:hypothetical protein